MSKFVKLLLFKVFNEYKVDLEPPIKAILRSFAIFFFHIIQLRLFYTLYTNHL